MQRMSGEEAKGTDMGGKASPFRCGIVLQTDKRHSAAAIDQAANSAGLQINSVLGLRRGNGTPCPLRKAQVQFANDDLIYSGPARGYIEGLEHRLRETENLLLQILPVVPEDYLEAVTSDRKGSPARS